MSDMTRDLFLAEIRRALKDHDKGDELLRFAAASIPQDTGDAEWTLTPPTTQNQDGWGWNVERAGAPLPEASNVNVQMVAVGLFEIRANYRPKNIRIIRP